ncbi:hypothetical protein [Mesorhizobium sp. CN2-181]|uniref:hypothetical protein n=1 Tax=Mesorhizobium yinganensis TaxID=3157707 RepID=UPI0032B725D7
MPVKRRTAKRRQQINADAVAAFVAGDEAALRDAMSLSPWEFPTLPPLNEASPWPEGSGGAAWWPEGQELHLALMEAAQ